MVPAGVAPLLELLDAGAPPLDDPVEMPPEEEDEEAALPELLAIGEVPDPELVPALELDPDATLPPPTAAKPPSSRAMTPSSRMLRAPQPSVMRVATVTSTRS
jgi:hypothetical protein